MHSTEVQTKPPFSWEALGWVLLCFWFFSTLLRVTIYISGYSGTNDTRDPLLFSSLWLIPAFLFSKRTKIIAAVVDVVLWAASLATLCYYVICGQGFSQNVLFVMFEANTNEASEYLSQYFDLEIVFIAPAYTVAAALLRARLRPVYILKLWRYVASFALLYGLIPHPIVMNTFIGNKSLEKALDSLASYMEPAVPWQFLISHYQYRQQLNSLTKLPNENSALLPLANFKDGSGNRPRTSALVIGESTQRGRVSLYGCPHETTSRSDTLHKTDPNLTAFNNIVTSCPYTIEILQRVLIFADERNPDLYLTQSSLMNMMEQAGYRTSWVTNQQMMTARNTIPAVFLRRTGKQYCMNQQRTQSAREYDISVLEPFQEVLNNPASKELIIVHLLGTHIKYKYRYPENQGKLDGNTDHAPPELNAEELESYNDHSNANLYNDHVVVSLIKDFKATNPNGFLIYFSDHGEEVYDTPPHKTQGCNEDNPMYHMYTAPFLLWMSEKRQAAHPRDLSQDVDRKYNLVELIHAWSDSAGLSYDGYDPTRSVVNLQLKETVRWIGNPYKKNAPVDHDTLPYSGQAGNQ